MKLPLTDVVDGAVGPFDVYCDGYGNPGSSGVGYVSVLTLSTGKVLKKMDHVLEGIVSYDRAEANDAYIGQNNMITASSFNGVNGCVWGYHLAKADALAKGSLTPIMRKQRHDGVEIPIWPVGPLLDAGERCPVRRGSERAISGDVRWLQDRMDSRRTHRLCSHLRSLRRPGQERCPVRGSTVPHT